MLPRDLPREQIHLRARSFDGDAVLESRDDRQVVRVAHDFFRRRQGHRGPELNFGTWISEAGRHHADDGKALVVKVEVLADDVAAAAETRLPKLVVENDYLIAAVGVFLLAEES